MSKGSLYPKLAFLNIKNNRKFYIPYLLTGMGTVMMGYVMLFITFNPGLQGSFGGTTVTTLMAFGCIIMAIFTAVLLFYTNSFLMKRRKMELGLFVVLGMEKRHLGLVQLFESIYVGLTALVGGLVLGVGFSKLSLTLLVKLSHVNTPLKFYVDKGSIAIVLIYFAALYFVIFLCNLVTVGKAKPVELLQGGKVGEKEPKAKWFLSLVGIITLGLGYAIALLVKDPLQAITLFFVAVLLVIIGTYLLFTTISIAVLKGMKANKSYYYKTGHFIGVSGMIYRMKQNAVGLGNICILSTMVLVMISSTVSLNIAAEDTLNSMYPSDLSVRYGYAVVDNILPKALPDIEELAGSKGITLASKPDYQRYIFDAVLYRDGGFINMNDAEDFNEGDIVALTALSDAEYSHLTGKQASLSRGEALVETASLDKTRALILPESFEVYGVPLRNTGKAESYPVRTNYDTSTVNQIHLVLSQADYESLNRAICSYAEVEDTQTHPVGSSQTTQVSSRASSAETLILNIYTQTDEDAQALEDDLIKTLNSPEYGLYYDEEADYERSPNWEYMYSNLRSYQAEDYYSMFGGLLFLGICLGLMFIMATILIIYYKQITEGYNDRDRFIIMRKVGLSDSEIKKTIRSQILTVFFLPLLAAVVHMCFAFNIITQLLGALNMHNVPLYVACTAGSIGIFALLYLLVFSITAREYYKIIS